MGLILFREIIQNDMTLATELVDILYDSRWRIIAHVISCMCACELAAKAKSMVT